MLLVLSAELSESEVLSRQECKIIHYEEIMNYFPILLDVVTEKMRFVK